MKKFTKFLSSLFILCAGITVLSCSTGGDDPEPETVATPAFSVESDSVISGTSVTITCATEKAKIYYTTDGSEPTASGNEYTTAITVTQAVTIKAIAVKEGMNDSEIASASYTIYDGPTYEVKFEVVGEEYQYSHKRYEYSDEFFHKNLPNWIFLGIDEMAEGGPEGEPWLDYVNWLISPSDVYYKVIDYIKEHKPSFETKTLKENEEYVLENKDCWMFGNEKDPESRYEVQYFSDEKLTNPIELGSIIENENKTIYIKLVYVFYNDGYVDFFRRWYSMGDYNES